MKLLPWGILMSLASIVVAPHSVAAQTITAATAAPSVTPANITTDIKFSATVTGRPTLVELTYLNGPAGHPIVVGQLRKKACRDHDDDRDGGDNDHDRDCRKGAAIVYTLSKRFNLPVGQAQFQISAPGAQGQVVSPLLFVLSLTTPVGFLVNKRSLDVGGPLSFNNFNGQYIHGGFAPLGGAEIDISNEPLPPPLDNLIDIELRGADIKAKSRLTVSGVSCTKVLYTEDDFFPIQKVQVIYCPAGKLLYKFFLSYYTDDPNENQYLASFQQVVSGAKFTP